MSFGHRQAIQAKAQGAKKDAAVSLVAIFAAFSCHPLHFFVGGRKSLSNSTCYVIENTSIPGA